MAFASGEPVVSQAEAEGFTVFRAGLGADSRKQFVDRHPEIGSLPPSQIRSFFFTELFVRTELEPRVGDLVGVVERWAPQLLVHDVAEFAAPMVATGFGIPYADHSYGPLVEDDVARAAGEVASPYWRSHGLAPRPLGGLYRHLYLDVCPPSLQQPGPMPAAVQPIRIVGAAAGPSEIDLAWLDRLRSLPTIYITLGTVYNQNLAVFRTPSSTVSETRS